MKQKFSLAPAIYVTLLMIPVYWLIIMSFKSNGEIFSGISPLPQAPTLENYRLIFSDPDSTLPSQSPSPFQPPMRSRAIASSATAPCCSGSLPSE